jgi:hypothetical protein
MNGNNKLRRRFILLVVLLTALFASTNTRTSASDCPYGPDCGYEPNICEQRCFDQFDVCMSTGATYSACDTQRYYCLYRCGW